MMKNKGAAVTLVLFLCLAAVAVLAAQDDSSQKAVAELKESLAANQKALAQYAWNMRTTISLKGEDKSWTVEQVQIGADGQQQKTLISKSPVI